MDNIIRFPGKNDRPVKDVGEGKKQQKKIIDKLGKLAPKNMSQQETLLLRLADEIDVVVLNAILQHSLPAPEVAAILAHRIGHLVIAMANLPGGDHINRQEFFNYLCKVIERECINPDTEVLDKSS